jgi:hypothetical protein
MSMVEEETTSRKPKQRLTKELTEISENGTA